MIEHEDAKKSDQTCLVNMTEHKKGAEQLNMFGCVWCSFEMFNKSNSTRNLYQSISLVAMFTFFICMPQSRPDFSQEPERQKHIDHLADV